MVVEPPRPAAGPEVVARGATTVTHFGEALPTAGNGWHEAERDAQRSSPALMATAGAGGRPGGHEPPIERPATDTVAGPGCTTAQLRRFIKSRPWVPMHELRRRFGINGAEDDVAPIEVDGRRVFVGLPPREAVLVAELVRGGDIGVELSLDPGCPMVIGVYPMRPISRS